MPEEVEIETKELQETIDELQEERKERAEEQRRSAWTGYIALTTAFLAVFAAIGALQSGGLVNEAMLDQLRASDKWNEYQAARQKEHLYTLSANSLVDAGAKRETPQEGKPAKPDRPPEGGKAAESKPEHGGAKPASHGGSSTAKPALNEKKSAAKVWKPLSLDKRAAQYIDKVDKEAEKEEGLMESAKKLEEESQEKMHLHHRFAQSVALIQVAIALSAVAALTRKKPIWGVSLVAGLIGVCLFVLGFVQH